MPFVLLIAVGVVLLSRMSNAVSRAVGGATTGLPPELPAHPHDVGKDGDLLSMTRAQTDHLLTVLSHEESPSALFLLADDVEASGFPIAANRLRQKALRIAGGG